MKQDKYTVYSPCFVLDTVCFVLGGSALRRQRVSTAKAACVTGLLGLALSAFWVLISLFSA